MKKLLVLLLTFMTGLSKGNYEEARGNTEPEPTITINFVDPVIKKALATRRLPKRHIQLSGTLKDLIADIGESDLPVQLEYKHLAGFDLMLPYLEFINPRLAFINDPQEERNSRDLVNQSGDEFKKELDRWQPYFSEEDLAEKIDELEDRLETLHPAQLGAIANIADYLDIELILNSALDACEEQFSGDPLLQQQFFASNQPENFNPHNLNRNLLDTLKKEIIRKPIEYLSKIREIKVLASGNEITTLALSRDGKTLASNATMTSCPGNPNICRHGRQFNGVQILWRDPSKQLYLQKNILINNPLDSRNPVTALQLNANGTMFVSQSEDKRLRIWNKTEHTWQELQTIESQNDAFALSKSGAMLVSSSGGDITIWQRNDGQFASQQVITPMLGDITAMALSHDEKTLLAGTTTGNIIIFEKNSSSGLWTQTQAIKPYASVISGLVFTADDKTFIAGSADYNFINKWHFENNTWQQQDSIFLDCSDYKMKTLAFSMKDPLFIIGSHESLSIITPTTDGRHSIQLIKDISNAVITPDGKKIIATHHGLIVELTIPSRKLLSDLQQKISFAQALLLDYAEEKQGIDISQYSQGIQNVYGSFTTSLQDVVKPLVYNGKNKVDPLILSQYENGSCVSNVIPNPAGEDNWEYYSRMVSLYDSMLFEYAQPKPVEVESDSVPLPSRPTTQQNIKPPAKPVQSTSTEPTDETYYSKVLKLLLRLKNQ